MAEIRIQHFSDALCVWAYIAQIRVDELKVKFPREVAFDFHFLPIFGSVHAKLRDQWGERGGAAGYAKHVREVVGRFDHVTIHPDVWSRVVPTSSMPCHLLLSAIKLLEPDRLTNGESPGAALERAAWLCREAFFAEAADISRQEVLWSLVERAGLSVAPLESSIASGAAHAVLCGDLELARNGQVRTSPTMIFNDGRQTLTGNVGYRVIEANVRELLHSPAGQLSWC